MDGGVGAHTVGIEVELGRGQSFEEIGALRGSSCRARRPLKQRQQTWIGSGRTTTRSLSPEAEGRRYGYLEFPSRWFWRCGCSGLWDFKRARDSETVSAASVHLFLLM